MGRSLRHALIADFKVVLVGLFFFITLLDDSCWKQASGGGERGSGSEEKSPLEVATRVKSFKMMGQ